MLSKQMPTDSYERDIYFAQLMNSRKKVERDAYVEVKEDQVESGAVCCMMDAAWVLQWWAFVEEEMGSNAIPPPGPISNHRLVSRETGLAYPGLLRKHYRCVSEATWRVLHGKYGGGPLVRRASNSCSIYSAE